MDGYGYGYPPSYLQAPVGPGMEYPDHGDGYNQDAYGEYFNMGPISDDMTQRATCSKYQSRKSNPNRGSATRTLTETRSRSRSRSRSKSRSRSRSRSRSHSRSIVRRDPSFREPGFLDAFRVMYLTPSKHRKSTTMYLETKKRQDRLQGLLKNDGLGSKKWLFYPRKEHSTSVVEGEGPGPRENVDQRVRVDGDFFRKYKRSKKIARDAPIAKLKRWELVLYKKLGFIQAI